MEVHHKHSPVRNWREFAKEVGIIVLGVVIALGGEQAVEAIHHHSEVRELRAALNEELAFDMGVNQRTVEHMPCIDRRLAELERWRQSWKTGHPLKLERRLVAWPTRSFRTAIWRTAAGPAVALMPLKERMAYAQFYDSIDNVASFRDQAGDAWRDMIQYLDRRSLSDADLGKLQADLGIIDSYYYVGKIDYGLWVREFAPQVHVTPQRITLDPKGAADAADFCKPILVS